MTKPHANLSLPPDEQLLIVSNDDNESYYLGVLLHRFKYRIVTAKTAAQALASLAAAMPVLLITTQTLPDMSAADLIARLNQNPGANNIPVIILGKGYDVGAEEHARASGAAAYLTTPIQPEDISKAVASALVATPRKNVRIHTSLPATIDDVQLDYERGECVSTLSEQGMHVKSYQLRRRKKVHSVRVRINDRNISVVARVLYRQQSRDGSLPDAGMGLKFVRISPEDRQFIKQHIMGEVMRGVSDGWQEEFRERTKQ